MLTFPRSFALRGLLVACLLPVGCSSDKDDKKGPVEEGDGNGDSNGDSGTQRNDAGTRRNDASANRPDARINNDYDPDSGACNAVNADGVSRDAPVDIVWTIDNSPSMADDYLRIQQNMANFANSLLSKGLDYHIIVNAFPPIDPAPLGLDPMRFFSYPAIAFNDVFLPTVASVGAWQANLRPDSALHFIMVSDDNSPISWPDFKGQMDSALGRTDYTVHAIVDPPQHCLTSTQPGTAYWTAAAATGGQQRSICEADWTPTFTAIEDTIKTSAEIPCLYDIPTPDQGQTYDFSKINVQHKLNGNATPYKRKDSMDACSGETGWYYDDPANPKKVLLCPAACSEVEAQGGSINVEFVCNGIIFQ